MPAIILAGILLAAGTVFRDILRGTPYSWAEYLTLLSAYLPVGGRIVRKAFSRLIVAGNDSLLHRENVPHDVCDVEGTAVYLAVDGCTRRIHHRR